MGFWDWLTQGGGLIQGEAWRYDTGQGLNLVDYSHAIRTAINNLAFASDPTAAQSFYERLKAAGGLVPGDDINYYLSGRASPAEIENLIEKSAGRLFQAAIGGEAGLDRTPGQVGNSVIPQGGRLVRVTNPEGSDAGEIFYVLYAWRGIELAYEVGDTTRFRELFGSVENFPAFTTVNQASFDEQPIVLAGSIDQKLNQTESEGSLIEREIRAQGLEDLPSWLANSQDALLLLATATAQQWSSGRLWQELSGTTAFGTRYGDVISRYQQEGLTIGEAVQSIERDEEAMRTALRPFGEADLATVHGLLNQGWTPGFAAQVLEQAEVLERDPDSLRTSNFILEASGLPSLDEVGFLNALAGFGPQDVVETLNTATAARALDEAGIDLDDDDLNLIMELVDQSDRLLTVDSWRQLSQELAFNVFRFSPELDKAKLGIDQDDLVAAAFGKESPSGKSSGEIMSTLARLERDRRAAGTGFDTTTGFIAADGRLRIGGLAGL